MEDADWKRYADDFEEEDIDGKGLKNLTIQKLGDYGVKSIHRAQLLREIRQLFFTNVTSKNISNSSYSSDEQTEDPQGFKFPSWFEIIVDSAKVREGRDTDSQFVKKLYWGKRVKCVERSGRRMRIVDPCHGWLSWETAQGKKILTPCTAGYNGDSGSDYDDETTIQAIADRRREQREPLESSRERVDRGWGDTLKRQFSSMKNIMTSRDELSSPRKLGSSHLDDDDEPSTDEERVRGLKKKHDENNMSENELALLNNKLDLATSEVSELRDQIYDKDREVEKLKRELRESRERDNGALRDELEDAQRRRDDLLDDKEAADDTVAELKLKLDNMEREFDTYKKKYKAPAPQPDSDDDDYYKSTPGSGNFSKTRRYSNDSLDDRPRRYSNESPRSKDQPRTRGRANSDELPRQRRRLSSDDGEGNIAISRGPEHNYREDSPGAMYQKNYRRTPGDDTYVETGVDEEFDDRDRYDTPSKMKSSGFTSDPEFDEDWSSKSSKRNNSPAWRSSSKYDEDDDDMNEAERRAWRRGKEDYSWFVRYDAKGKPYYYNSVTKSKRNDKPGTLDSDGQLKIHDPVILCEYDGIWYKAQLLEPASRENWYVRFDCGDVKRASIHREHIRKWVAWLEEEY